ncbi:MAG: Ger(x)C family spore germination protein [Bacillota bacterium]
MRGRYVKLITLMLAVLLFATGCWDSMDIEDKNIATTVIFDKKDGEYRFSIEIASISSNLKNNVDAANSSNSYEASGFMFVDSKGATIPETRANMDQQMDKPLYLSAVRALVITERAAETDLAEYLFRLQSIAEYRQKVNLFVTSEEPEDLEHSKTENASSFGFAVDDMLQHLVDNGQAFSRMMSRYVDNILSHSGFCIPCIDLQGNSMVLSGYCVIDYQARCVGFISIGQAKGLLLMKADKPKADYVVPLGENQATVEVELAQKETKPAYRDGKISFDMQYGFDARVQYFKTANPMPMDENMRAEITQKLGQMLKNELMGTIQQSQKEFMVDYLQFDDEFRVAFPEEFKNMDWAKEYPNAGMELNVEVNLEAAPRLDYNPS